jgi:hypothetical protein
LGVAIADLATLAKQLAEAIADQQKAIADQERQQIRRLPVAPSTFLYDLRVSVSI